MLSSLICPPDDDEDNFTLNPFPEQFNIGTSGGSSSKDKEDENTVFIDLTLDKPKNEKIEQVKKQMEEFDIKNNNEKDDDSGDDMLDLMDNL